MPDVAPGHRPGTLPVPGSGPAAAPSRPRRSRLDWARAAELLARGDSAEDVARQLGCPPQRVLRNLRRSRRFRLAIESAHARLRLCGQLRFALLGDIALQHLQQSARLDPRLLQWLGDRTGLASAGDPEGVLAARFEAAMRPESVVPPAPGRSRDRTGAAPARYIDEAELRRIIGDDDD